MSAIRVRYHREPDGWWADSPDVEGFVASGADLTEVRDLVKSGIPFYLDDPDVEIEEESAGSASQVIVSLRIDPHNSIAVYPQSDAMALGWAEHPSTLLQSTHVQIRQPETVG